MNSEDPICIVPARGTSPGLPKKNFKRINGKPLVAHTIESALESDCFESVFVSTESEGIANIARDYGANVPFLRPLELSGESAMLQSVVHHTIEQLDSGVNSVEIMDDTPVVVLQPNIPFRLSGDIKRALSAFKSTDKNVLITVVQENRFYWQQSGEGLSPLFSERQMIRDDLNPLYRETGSITITTPPMLADGNWTGTDPAYLLTDKLSSFEVRSLIDFWLAEQIAQGPSIVFRVDGGGEIGLGKIYRALTLATALRNSLNCRITFISDKSNSGGVRKLGESPFETVAVSNETEAIRAIDDFAADILFIDVQRPIEEYLRQFHQASTAVVNLEDIGESAEYADYVLNSQRDSGGGQPVNHLTGTDYLVLREEFKHTSRKISEKPTNILLTFGGSDPLGLSVGVLTEVSKREMPFTFRLVLGPDFGSRKELDTLPDEFLANIQIQSDVSNMAELMQWADVAISSGGRTAYELAATGTPSIIIAQNEGEVERMDLLRRKGAIEFLGRGDRVNLSRVPDDLLNLANDYDRRREMSMRGHELIDGNGVERILDLVHEILIG